MFRLVPRRIPAGSAASPRQDKALDEVFRKPYKGKLSIGSGRELDMASVNSRMDLISAAQLLRGGDLALQDLRMGIFMKLPRDAVVGEPTGLLDPGEFADTDNGRFRNFPESDIKTKLLAIIGGSSRGDDEAHFSGKEHDVGSMER
ncbi:hypothetical protein HOY82DRAFT_595520 [Tuber indicum]|nr:hypothetical protein HOY82DRAFT_595520 [Tuber indicum]